MALSNQQFTNPQLPIWREAFAGADWMRLHMSPTYTGWGVRKGRGEPVVLVPGFLASDASMVELKLWLERMGYRSYFARFGRNTGCPKELTEKLCERVEQAQCETEEPVTLIGHSLGGCLARSAAIACPENVKQVVTLGSPVNGARVHPLVMAAGEYVRRGECDATCYLPMMLPLPPGVTETSIFSKTDGIVDWHTCTARGARAVEVSGTHIGMVWNPQVYREIARALAPDDEPTEPAHLPRVAHPATRRRQHCERKRASLSKDA